MAFDGSGTFTVLYNWATEAASPPIAISKLDAEMAGIATGLSSCMLRTGGTVTGATTFNAAVTISAAIPYLLLSETGVTADNGKWAMLANGEEFSIRAYTDDLGTVSQPMLVTRTSTTVDAITFTGTQINLTGTATAVNGALGVTSTLTVGSIDLTPTTGTFTARLRATVGGADIATVTAKWKKVGNVVQLRIPNLTGTSTAATYYIQSLPADIQAADTQFFSVAGYNNTQVHITAIVYASQDYIQLTTNTGGTFDAGSNTKGLLGTTLTYLVD